MPFPLRMGWCCMLMNDASVVTRLCKLLTLVCSIVNLHTSKLANDLIFKEIATIKAPHG
jgi:hypothetical protein